eukprot:GEMP01011133.1.p1 GENE.GEMP01011133.1~~GEMP01011133.1.p1  ORF type:complete len:432 (+),score=104.67 GEMP01011133.1:155-1450(+)
MSAAIGAIEGPAPLVRTNGDALEVKPAGLQLLNALPQSSRIITVFAVGGSRAGKSTLGNSLLEGGVAFPTSNGFASVTDGIDVATLVVDKNTVLVYCDCEGSFHINASHTNPQSFGPMAVLAYVCTDYLAHVSMGNVDERDVQSLAFLAASASRREDDCKPKLLVIINNPRFSDLASDPTQVLAAAWEGTQFTRDDPRVITREALRAFQGPDFICLSDLQSSPEKYRQEVLNLRKMVIAGVGESPPGRSTGPELGAFIDFAVSELNKAGNVKPEAAVDSVYRQLQLEPLMELLERDFVGKLRMQEPGPHALRHARYVHEALMEYDKKTSRMPASTSLKSGSRLALAKRLKRMQEIAKIEEECNKENHLAQGGQLIKSTSTCVDDDRKESVNKDDFARFYQRIEASERWLEEFESHLQEQTEWLEQALSSDE